MSLFLTDAWITDMDALLRAAQAPADIPSVTIEQQIVGVSNADEEPELIYQIIVGPQRCWAAKGSGTRPTITYRQTRETAEAIARESRTAHEAFMLGDLLVEGDPNGLTEALPAMNWLGEILEPLRHDTQFC